MTLEEALAQKKKLLPMPEGFLCETVIKDRVHYMWVIRLLYGHGYEVIKNEESKEK